MRLFRNPSIVYKASVLLALQLNYYGTPYVAGVVLAHVAFALLEKTRLENFRETGEVRRQLLNCIFVHHVSVFLQRPDISTSNSALCACCTAPSGLPPPPPPTNQQARTYPPTYPPTHTFGLQAGHFGTPTFDPLGITEENPLGTDYNRQAEVTNFIMAPPQ